jgi:monothiol glutaredoxin
MAISSDTRQRIEAMLQSSSVLLFMKGTRQQPQCGFSMQVVRTLDRLIPSYETFDVLSDAAVRDGIKQYSDWPTIPQLYVGGELIGGCDIVNEMYASGELHEALGLGKADVAAPAIEITDAAAQVLKQAQTQSPGAKVRLAIDARFQNTLALTDAEPGDFEVVSNGCTLVIDRDSARRAHGLRLDATESARGPTLSVVNPNEPTVASLTAAQVKELMDAGTPFELLDARTESERAQANIAGSCLLDAGVLDALQARPKDTKIVVYCHSGMRSAAAAKELALMGFADVSNLEGGIEAWSRQVDPSVPRY